MVSEQVARNAQPCGQAVGRHVLQGQQVHDAQPSWLAQRSKSTSPLIPGEPACAGLSRSSHYLKDY